uniref:GOLD domain-containing protein n=1 Tax=Ditylenchus dipsaci TaxID=166011 RepID=A0A915DAB5_9BILA
MAIELLSPIRVLIRVFGANQQEQLISQLQEQHYNQYMAQVYAQQAQAQAVSLEGGQCQALANPPPPQNGTGSESSEDSEMGVKPADAYLQQGLERPPPKDRVRRVDENGEEEDGDKDSDVSDEEANDDAPPNPKIAPANLWNSKNIVEFKNTIRKEGPEGILKVGHGETVTVRVPTHEEGKSLFWEFATDYYDIGFGVYFEWTIAESNQVTVHISESSDEEFDEEAEQPNAYSGSSGAPSNDVEGGSGNGGPRQKPRDPNKPLVDEVIRCSDGIVMKRYSRVLTSTQDEESICSNSTTPSPCGVPKPCTIEYSTASDHASSELSYYYMPPPPRAI